MAVLQSGALVVLLLAVAVFAVVGAPVMLFGCVAVAWVVLASTVGPRNVLDAGCAFMLLVVGVVLVVDLAANGPAALLP